MRQEGAWHAALGTDSPLARILPHFRVRRQQQDMAERVAGWLQSGGVGLVEAGTGTGKSFAYLLPALLCERKVLISTGSRALQDQILDKDIPVLAKAWSSQRRVVRLKGRSNYLCPFRLQRALAEGAAPRLARDLLIVADWASRTGEGDIAELGALPESSPVWPLVTSTRDNCLGSDCPEYGHCPVVAARKRAQEADVVVVNHHLLLADLALRVDSRGDLLPRVDAIIIDEAHQLADLAGQYFGQHLSSHQLLEWSRDSRQALFAAARDDAELGVVTLLEQSIEAWLALGQRVHGGESRWEWPSGVPQELVAGLQGVAAEVARLDATLRPLREVSKELEQCAGRGQHLAAMLAFFLDSAQEPAAVRWLERRGRGLLLHASPIELGPLLRAELFERSATTILVSATLRVGEDFRAVEARLGLAEVEPGPQHFVADSPFDYARQALLYLPPQMPEPASPQFTAACIEAAIPVIEASGGRCFFLFTSHRALQEAAAQLPRRLAFPILVQGSMPRARLLDAFRRAGNAVLLGAASFWEGVDVQGETLSCVIIDKLPFANPSDPVLRARHRHCAAMGGDPFRDLQLPQAVIALRQGVGRLIRSESDRGVLTICDPRLLSKGYGRIFLRSLPPLPLVQDIAAVREFWHNGDGQ
ncbi:ATP-dependent DNA helicase [Acidithiobacillus sp.]|uniref:ATP-dependent DNA helicase n=1 Tax=Acidithiobacillus sp. TaxID=1872118 RepID=UPI0025B84373|nr:ATP-dependent DNA helicase [Acidithiobacillus sp.]